MAKSLAERTEIEKRDGKCAKNGSGANEMRLMMLTYYRRKLEQEGYPESY